MLNEKKNRAGTTHKVKLKVMNNYLKLKLFPLFFQESASRTLYFLLLKSILFTKN
jgi:hypothetical protein